jgi:hypothetical protein
MVAERAVKGTRGAFQVLRIDRTGLPRHRFAVDSERDGEIARGKATVRLRCVIQREGVGCDDELAALVRYSLRELGHGQAAIEKYKGGMIFELAVRSPFHTDELGCEHSEPCVPQEDFGARIGHRIGEVVDGGGLSVALGRHPHNCTCGEHDCGKVMRGSTHSVSS